MKFIKTLNLSKFIENQKNIIFILLACACLFYICSLVNLVFFKFVNQDEVEHLLVSYRMYLGDQVYKDFHQNHTPYFWYILMPFMSQFKGTILPLFFGRSLGLFVILIPIYLSRKILDSFSGDKLLNYFLYFFFILSIILSINIWVLRPEAYALLLSSFVYYILCYKPDCLNIKNSFLCGFLLGIAMGFTFKVYLLFFALPLVAIIFYKNYSFKFLFNAVFAHAVGAAFGLLILISYLACHDVLGSFYYDVILVNANLIRSTSDRLSFIGYMFFTPCIVGILYAFLSWKKVSLEQQRFFLVSAFWICSSFIVAFQASHNTFYNFQMLLIPASLMLALFCIKIINALNEQIIKICFCLSIVLMVTYQIYLSAWRPFYPTEYDIDLKIFKEVVALSGDGSKTCIGLAPWHPIYCKNVSEIMIAWDRNFIQARWKNYGYRQKYQSYWKDALDIARLTKPDLVFKGHFNDIWSAAKDLGAFSQNDLDQFNSVMSKNTEITLSDRRSKFWIASNSK